MCPFYTNLLALFFVQDTAKAFQLELFKEAAIRDVLFKILPPTQVFPCKICEVFGNTFFQEHLRTTLSVFRRQRLAKQIVSKIQKKLRAKEVTWFLAFIYSTTTTLIKTFTLKIYRCVVNTQVA